MLMLARWRMMPEFHRSAASRISNRGITTMERTDKHEKPAGLPNFRRDEKERLESYGKKIADLEERVKALEEIIKATK